MEAIFEIIVIWIFSYPGAGFRWFILRFWKSKKTFKDFLNDDSYMNGIIGLLILSAPVIIYNVI